jgi:anti-sigma factor RsiW
MRDIRERPVCHRAEDLVTYLYGEGNEADALDFGRHLQQCDACRSEFAVFNQVHDSIQLWRSDALGASLNSSEVIYQSANESRQIVPHGRKLSAIAALREFFSVSPLWLRGATAFAVLLLCVVAIVLIARVSRKPVNVAGVTDEKKYTRQEMQAEVNRAVEQTRQQLTSQQNATDSNGVKKEEPKQPVKRIQVATNQSNSSRPRSLNRQEREQLAADLRLTSSADEDEILLALPDQENPHQ